MAHIPYARHAILPRYRRRTQTFQELFGASPVDVLASMDKAGDDIPNAAPSVAIDIDAVGIRRPDIVVSITDPFGSGTEVSAVCSVSVAASVPKTRRGVHMSRIGQAIADSATIGYSDLVEYGNALAASVASSQYGHARVTVHGRIPYLEEVQADPSGRMKLSLEHLDVIVRHTASGDGASTDLGLVVTHIVACPCVQKTYHHAIGRDGLSDDVTLEDVAPFVPLMTHSQRCITKVIACDVKERRSPSDMLAKLDEVVVRTCSTLPRDAELACVYRAHRSPQFIEDALRAAVMALAELWPPSSFDHIVGRSRSVESIHEHDLTASLTVNASDLPRLG